MLTQVTGRYFALMCLRRTIYECIDGGKGLCWEKTPWKRNHVAMPGGEALTSDAYCKDTQVSRNATAAHSTPQDAWGESASSILLLQFCQVVRRRATALLYHMLMKILFHVLCTSSVLRRQPRGINTPFHIPFYFCKWSHLIYKPHIFISHEESNLAV